MIFTNPTPEEQEIEELIDAHQAAKDYQFFVFKVAAVAYLVGFPLFIFGSGMVERIGMAVTIVALVSFFYHMILQFGVDKKKRAVQEVYLPYLKRKTRPLFQEMQEKFADDPTIRFVHNDDGSVTVIRKKEGGEGENN